VGVIANIGKIYNRLWKYKYRLYLINNDNTQRDNHYYNMKSKKEKKEVIKHSSAIQVSNEVNLLQRKAWNVLLANAFDDLEKEEVFYINMSDLCKTLKFDSKNDKYIKQLLKELISIQIEWNVLGKDKQNGWGAASLLSEVQIINGVISYEYSRTVRKKLYNPNVYAKINLSLQNKFRSKYSLALYELFVDYYNNEIGIGQTPWITVEDFRKLMGLNNNEYKTFKYLNDRIIKSPIKEINKKTNINVTVEYKKLGRRINGIKFYISGEDKDIIEIIKIGEKTKIKKKEKDITELINNNKDLFETLTDEFGISKNKAIEILQTKDENFIKENLDVIRNKIKVGKVADVAGMTIDAIAKDYRSKKPQNEIEKEKKIAQEEQHKKEKKKMEMLKKQFDHHNKLKIEKIIQGLSKAEKDDEIKEFEKEEIEPSNQFIQKSYRKTGIENPFIKSFFDSYIAEKYLPEEDRKFRVWAKKKKHNIEKNKDGEYNFKK